MIQFEDFNTTAFKENVEDFQRKRIEEKILSIQKHYFQEISKVTGKTIEELSYLYHSNILSDLLKFYSIRLVVSDYRTSQGFFGNKSYYIMVEGTQVGSQLVV